MITIEVGEMALGLETAEPRLRALLEERHAGYLSTTDPHARIAIALDPRPFDRRQALHFVLSCDERSLAFRSCACDGWFDFERRAGRLAVVDAYPSTQDCIGNFLRFVYSALGADQGKLVLHAAGVHSPRTGAGHVFAGVSGAGKSTVALLSHRAGYEVLNDDLVVVAAGPAGPVVHGTPFCGDIRYKLRAGEVLPAVNRKSPLGGWYLLQQADEHRLEPLPPAEQAARLAGSVLWIDHFPAARAGRALAALQELTAAVPLLRLCFREDARFWQVIEAGPPGQGRGIAS